MKNFLISGWVIALLLCWSCSDDGEMIQKETNVFFLQERLEITPSAGEVSITVGWSATPWEIVMDADNGIVTQITPLQGGDTKTTEEYTKIKIKYNENTELKSRTQELFVINKTTGERSKLVIEQSSRYHTISTTITPSTKYQHVVGFGGMYNPVIWLRSNLITADDMATMYGPGGLGYNILRLMVYPNENDWAADVEGAKQAQQYGAIIFASPWDCTDALADKVTVNGKEVKHLKKENYQAYADHLVKYITYMKNNGVNLYAMSVQNEPDMDFTYWYPQEVVDFVKNYGEQIRATGVKLMSPEACGTSPEYTDPILNDPVAFAKTDIVAGHLYQGFTDWSSSYVKNRHDYIAGLYNAKLAAANKTWWMTEHLFNDGEGETNPSLWKFRQWSYEMTHLGKEIHASMEGYCSAYIYWYLKRFYGMIADNDQRSQANVGEVLGNGYILSHYARYASDMTRVKIQSGDSDLLATAYINESGTEMTIVFLNMKSVAVHARIVCGTTVKSVNAVESTATDKMKAITANVEDDKQGVYALLSANGIASVRIVL